MPRVTLDALPDKRRAQEEALRRGLDVVRRRGDRDAERIICAWLDDLYVSRAHQRAADPAVRRYRRMRGAA